MIVRIILNPKTVSTIVKHRVKHVDRELGGPICEPVVITLWSPSEKLLKELQELHSQIHGMPLSRPNQDIWSYSVGQLNERFKMLLCIADVATRIATSHADIRTYEHYLCKWSIDDFIDTDYFAPYDSHKYHWRPCNALYDGIEAFKRSWNPAVPFTLADLPKFLSLQTISVKSNSQRVESSCFPMIGSDIPAKYHENILVFTIL